MLAPKKISAKKMKLYLIALAIVLIGLAFVLFKNLFPASQPVSLPAESDASSVLNNEIKNTDDQVLKNELDFISTGKWQSLRDNVEVTETPEAGNKNPFAAKK